MSVQLSRLVFILAIFAVGSAAPLARMAEGMHPISLGFGRVVIVGLLMAIWAGVPRMSMTNWARTVFAAVCLAGHFWLWFASLEATTVLRSTVLVCLNPLWVGLWEWFTTKHFNKLFWMGTLIAISGACVMSVFSTTNAAEQSATIYGDVLAIAAGLLGSMYLIATKSVRASVAVHAYTAAVCLLTALCLWGVGTLVDVVVLEDVFVAPWVVVAMALGPQLFGHAGLTWCLKKIEASTVALGLLLEPAGAALLAWWWFGEAPTISEVVGSIIILIGLWIAVHQNKAH